MLEDHRAAPPVAKPRSPHLSHIDGLRGFAALFVAYSHLLPRAWGDNIPETLVGKLWGKVSPMSHFAVSAFILLSGYCLMLPLLKTQLQFKSGLPNYFMRRFLRIAPALYAAFILSIVLATQIRDTGGAPAITASHPVTWIQVIAHGLFLQSVIPNGLVPYNGVFWSVGVEWWIYFSLPVLLWLWRRSGNRLAVTIVATAAYYLLFYAVRNTPLAGFHFEYFALFAIGVFCAAVAHESTPTKKSAMLWLGIALTAFVANFAIIGLVGWKTGFQYAHLFDLLFSVFFFALLIFLAQSPSHFITRFWAHPWLVTLGGFSYSLYLIHFPLETIFCERILLPLHLNEITSLALLFFVCMPLVCIASYIFYQLVEKPTSRWSQSLKKAPSEQRIQPPK